MSSYENEQSIHQNSSLSFYVKQADSVLRMSSPLEVAKVPVHASQSKAAFASSPRPYLYGISNVDSNANMEDTNII